MRTFNLLRWIGPALLAGAAMSCAVPGSGEDGGGGGPLPGEPGGAGVPGEGEQGSAMFLTATGWQQLSFTVHRGRALHEGDIDLGPVEEIGRRGLAVPLGDRWPNGNVYFQFEDDIASSERTIVRAALVDLASKTPVSFTESEGDGDYILFEVADSDEIFSGRAQVGYQGGEQWIELNRNPDHLGFQERVIQHEVLHALGVWHEQSRSDRDTHIVVNTDCVISGHAGNFDIHDDDDVTFGPYDYLSIMHYARGAFCNKDAAGECLCLPINKVGGVPGQIRGGVLSAEDVNALTRMYSEPLASDHTGDRFGAAIATGDFDNDGYDDVAVGIPGHDIGGVTDAGMVLVYKGTNDRLVYWRTLGQTLVGGQNEAGDQFGDTLAVGDFNGDGLDDLAVGAPREDVLSNGVNVPNSGAVFLFLGSTDGPVADRILTQIDVGATDESGDLFGIALAAGPIAKLTSSSGKPIDQLAIGTMNERIIEGSSNVRSGAVFIYHRLAAGAPIAAATRLVQPLAMRTATDELGSAIAVRDIDGEGHADLVIGATELIAGGGAVYVYRGLTPSPLASPPSWTPMATFVAEVRPLGTPLVGDRFGEAVAIGQFDAAGMKEIAVGSPGRTSARGRVIVFRVSASLDMAPTFTQTQTLYQTASADEDGDEFGSALAVGRFAHNDGYEDLLVGVPGENSNAGAAYWLAGSASLLSNPVSFRSLEWTAAIRDEGAGDRFGEAVAVANIDKFGPGPAKNTDSPISAQDIIIGAPGETVVSLGGALAGAGAIFSAVTPGFSAASVPVARDTVRQGTVIYE